MRLSVDQDDQGYKAWKLRGGHKRPVRVLLNGRHVKRVITADTKRGFVLAYQEDAEGKAIVNARRTDMKRYRQYGNVEIEFG